MFPFVSLVCAYMHVYLDASSAGAFASHWRPQLVAGNIMSVSGLNMYTRARIALSDKRCAGAVVQYSSCGRPCMFLLERNDVDQLHISCILWHPSNSMLQDMRALRTWYEMRFSDELYGGSRMESTERDTWDITSYDA